MSWLQGTPQCEIRRFVILSLPPLPETLYCSPVVRMNIFKAVAACVFQEYRIWISAPAFVYILASNRDARLLEAVGPVTVRVP